MHLHPDQLCLASRERPHLAHFMQSLVQSCPSSRVLSQAMHLHPDQVWVASRERPHCAHFWQSLLQSWHSSRILPHFLHPQPAQSWTAGTYPHVQQRGDPSHCFSRPCPCGHVVGSSRISAAPGALFAVGGPIVVLVAGLAAFRARAAAEGVHSLSAFQTHFRSIIHGMSPYPHGANVSHDRPPVGGTVDGLVGGCFIHCEKGNKAPCLRSVPA